MSEEEDKSILSKIVELIVDLFAIIILSSSK